MASSPRRAAVLGHPIAHSLSPTLHRAAYAALGLDWRYEAIECMPSELAAVLAGRADWAGFSCTMPLKHAALLEAHQVSDTARVVGAANTLLPLGSGRWLADNTDVAGIVASLRGTHHRACVLGAGGTAQAAVLALAQMDVAACTVLVRDVARAARIVATAERAELSIEVSTLDPASPALAADLVISTLPAYAADPFAVRVWRPEQTVLDVVYQPWPTELAQSVAAAGATVVSGALMLLHQAAVQVELMTGRAAPVAAMRAALAREVSAGLG
ncbi:MAG: shikimate dehydrogenase [Actinomycetota bacterium]|nr:shikimate dehydrogenase [Actinomycetota bacterium]